MKTFTEAQLQRSILQINEIVERESPASALHGLILAAHAFAGLLDVYAQPNEDNPQGMCDDPAAFRTHFAEIIVAAPTLKKKIALPGGAKA